MAYVQVSRSGDETSPAFRWGYVYTVSFVGSVDALHIPPLAVDTSALGAATHAHVHTVQEGAGLGSMAGSYVALRPGTAYAVRVKARNAEGWGAYSTTATASTAAVALVPGPPTAVLAGGCGVSATTLSLDFAPPVSDGGSKISHYRIEWDTDAGFTQSSGRYGTAALAVVHEVQTVRVDFRSADDLTKRAGTFTLAWGGVRTAPLAWDVTAADLAIAVHAISGLEDVGEAPVGVTRAAFRHGYRWDVTFKGRRGDLGLMQADGTLLAGDDPSVIVRQRTAGKADLIPGSFTFEEQAVAVSARSAVTSGTFRLRFEGKPTAPIRFDEPRASFK